MIEVWHAFENAKVHSGLNNIGDVDDHDSIESAAQSRVARSPGIARSARVLCIDLRLTEILCPGYCVEVILVIAN